MKKLVGVLVVLALMLNAFCVFAESTATTVFNADKSDDVDQYFTTSGTIENNKSGFVTIVVTSNDQGISVDNIMYIDQTASSSGNFSFTDYIPKENLKVGDKFPVKIGATALSAPISGGYLEIPAPASGKKVSGSVTFLGMDTKATVKLINSAGSVIKNTEIGLKDGESAASYAFEGIEDGAYTVRIDKKAYLPGTVAVTVSGEDVTADSVILSAGDVVKIAGEAEKEYNIDLSDLNMVLAGYGSVTGDSSYAAGTDINEDDSIDLSDLNLLLSNYGKTFTE